MEKTEVALSYIRESKYSLHDFNLTVTSMGAQLLRMHACTYVLNVCIYALVQVFTSQNLVPAKIDKNLNQNAESSCNRHIL